MKMNLGKTFLRAVLYSRQNVVRIELIKPKIAIAILAYKLYAENKRVATRIVKLIKLYKEKIIVEYSGDTEK